jgi:hypothetical protein
MTNNRELQEKPQTCTSGKRTGDTSIELWNSTREKGQIHQTKENEDVRR